VVEDELKRLRGATSSETLLMTDLGLEEPTIAFLRRFAATPPRRQDPPAAARRAPDRARSPGSGA
jgi:hypothetical protein